MRIIAGLYKGFSLHSFPGNDIRPTPSKVREAVFDILGVRIIESDFLDLFAGTGAVGIEALSRGAKRATFVEVNRKAIEIIKKNLIKIRHNDFNDILIKDYFQAFKILNSQQRKYDIIFLDPPFDKNYSLKSLQEIEKRHIIKKNGIVVIQHQINENLPGNFQRLICLKEKRYGKSRVTFFRYQE